MSLVRLFQAAAYSVLELQGQLREQHQQHCQHWSPHTRRLVERMETLLKTVCFLNNKRSYQEAVQCLQLLLWCATKRVRHTFSCAAVGASTRMKSHGKVQSDVNQVDSSSSSSSGNGSITQRNIQLTFKISTVQQMMYDLLEQRLAAVQPLLVFPLSLPPDSTSLQRTAVLASFLQRKQMEGTQQKHNKVLVCTILQNEEPDIELLPPSPDQSQPLPQVPADSAAALPPSPQLLPSFPSSSSSDSSCTPPTTSTNASTPSILSPHHNHHSSCSSCASKKKWKGSGERFAALPVAKRLTFTGLRIHEIGEEIVLIASDIQQSTCLRKLDLSSSDIGDAGAIAIADALPHSTSLNKLSLGYNEIGIRGAMAVAKAIKHSTCLTKLNLSSNDLGNAGAVAIASALRHSTSLTSISLAHNDITARGTQAIADAIKLSTTISYVDLKYNNIRTAGAAAIAECIQDSPGLMEIDLSNTDMGSLGLSMIHRAMLANPRVKVTL